MTELRTFKTALRRVRINPEELHIDDPDFYPEIYCNSFSTRPSALEQDARFLPFFTKKDKTGLGSASTTTFGCNVEVETLLLMLKTSTSEPASRLAAMMDVVNKVLVRIPRLSEPMDPGRSFSVFGVDSPSAVEVRNYPRLGSQRAWCNGNDAGYLECHVTYSVLPEYHD